VLSALEGHGVGAGDAVELSRRAWPPVAAVEPAVESAVATNGPAAATWRFNGAPPLAPGGARAVVLALAKHDASLLALAQERASEYVMVLTPEAVPTVADGWRIVDERPGAHPVVQRLARVATRCRWKRLLGYTTAEHADRWRSVIDAASFGEGALRLYVLRRYEPRPPAVRWHEAGALPGEPPSWRAPLKRSKRAAAVATKALRLLRAEWYLRRGHISLR
jgi:hypothetical protein